MQQSPPQREIAENLTDSVRNGVQVPELTVIPDGFVPTGAVICEFDRSVGVVDHALSLVEMRHRGDLTAVLAAYAVPSDPRDMTCHVDQPMPPTVWLIDDQGLGMRPALPLGRCGEFKWEAIEAVKALPVTERIVHPIPVTPEQEAQWTDIPG
ncbi:hypothetical protein [Rhodococcus sp. OK302]|uniref:hypothetical protein n=1 Tax=Rhodococcus sp. OK302 TaxID=1882769 RepID=UPI000B9F7543|nr:hypothetical protein [Rhodococcus sp. OK302]OYD70203.1 hypothetical protein BDB13_3800 [Rhodococcus sp. OK302]